MTQPEALRLADALEQEYCSCHEGFKIRNRIDPQCESCQTKDWRNEAAAELRRLHDLLMDQQGEIYALNMARSMEQKTAALKQAALLEALKYAEAGLADIGDADREPGDDLAWCEARAAKALPLVRAAIAKVEGEKQ